MKTQHYEIWVEGRLGSSWSDWFEGLVVGHEKDASGEPVCTVLWGRMDQAMLHGVLAKVRDLGLVLVAVNQRRQGEQGK